MYIKRRNFEILVIYNINGSTLYISRRIYALWTKIPQDPVFLIGFATEKWRGRPLYTNNNNFITHWLVTKG
jgi:hypothetical protein